ncbi:hypothetical protein [Sandarakinorhabdus sp.]|uniref:hypothetical protein n=1 Tax=Sandarakinorhabdus sp. TaxID=1916663 RepID=UPI003F71B444
MLVAACGSKTPAPVSDGATCYPPAAAAYIKDSDKNAAAPRDTGGPYSLYLDGSASMVGYIRGGSATDRLLPDLVGMLPELQQIDRGQLKSWRFDRKFTELDSAARQRMQTEGGYLCPAGEPNCDAQESHIDAVFERVAGEPADALSVIVSDLWLVNDEVLTSSGVAFAKPFGKIFASGRSIAIYGFESPYAGRVSDLPSGRRDVTAAGRHLFVVVAGPAARMQAFHRAMQQAPSSRIANALTNGTAHHALFTLEPMLGGAGGQGLTAAGGSALKKFQFLTPRQGVIVSQFSLDRAAALRSAKADPGATWPGVSADAIRPGAVWRGPLRGETRIWRQVGDACAPKGADWQAEGKLSGGWSADGTGSYRLDPATLAALGSGTFMLVGEATRVSLTIPNPDTAWLRDWSFNASQESEAVTRKVVPTLNLSETARLLELALLDAAERQPVRLGGFATVVKID